MNVKRNSLTIVQCVQILTTFMPMLIAPPLMAHLNVLVRLDSMVIDWFAKTTLNVQTLLNECYHDIDGVMFDDLSS